MGGVGGAEAAAEMRMDGMPRMAGLVPVLSLTVAAAIGKDAVTALVPVDELWAVAANSTGGAAVAQAPATPAAAAADAPAAVVPAAGTDDSFLPASADPAVPPDNFSTCVVITPGGPVEVVSGGATLELGVILPPDWAGGPVCHLCNLLPASWACTRACCSLAFISRCCPTRALLPCKARSRSDTSLAACNVARQLHI